MGDKLDLKSLRDAVASLDEGIRVVDSAWFGDQASAVRNIIVAGVIQNFEFVHEISAKMIRRQLELEAQDPGEIDYEHFRDILRVAGEKGLIEDVGAWFDYRKLRNLTWHTYDHERATFVYGKTAAFLRDAR